MSEYLPSTREKPGILKKIFIGIIILIAASFGKVIANEFSKYLFKKNPPAFNWQTQTFKNIQIESPLLLKPVFVSTASFPKEVGALIKAAESYRASASTISIGMSFIEYKEGVEINLEKALEGGLNSGVKSMNPNANPVFTKSSFHKNEIDGLVGTSSQNVKGSTINVKMLVFLKNQKMYNAMFVWSTGEASETDADRFFNSIKIDKNFPPEGQ